ncbi:MAG: Mut7-C RNAse domain-containing protein [Methanomassiliicoccales archaeon]|nr:Mut7-C RNAse domain-containing protein [Methanomassiliicoccales archaeon]
MAEPSFLLDGMLGSLARWLRIMGYDARYMRDLADADMLRLLQGNERHLLTRDRQLAERAGERGFCVSEMDLDAQLLAVVAEFGLRTEQSYRRCTACNGELQAVDRGSVKDEVAEGTWNGYQDFWRCASCGKVYWQGAHWKNIEKRLEGLSRGPGNSPR